MLHYCIIIHAVEHLRRKCPGEQRMLPYLCHMRSVAPCQETRYPALSSAAFTSAMLCRSARKRRCEPDFDRGLGTQKNMMFYFCTLPLNTKNTAFCVRSKCWATSCRASYKPVVRAWWDIDLKLSWPWLRWWVMVLGCSLGSLLSCFHALKGWGGLAVIVTVSVHIDMLYAHRIERGTDPLCNYVCVRAYVFLHKQFWACACVSVGRLGTDTIEIQTRPFTNPPQPLQSWPWLILLSFTFLSEIYFVLPWLVFYGLMTCNRSHHQGQLQLQPLCLCSSKCSLVCCLWDPFGLEFQSSLNLLWL